MTLQAGEQIDRYELLNQLGEGGQGSVWRVRDLLPPHPVRALKIASLRGMAPASIERCRREARLLAELSHPSLVRCHGLFENYERDVVGLVLDFADGTNLRACVDDPRFDRGHRQAALRQIAEALAYLHGRGLVHRDVKLENVVVTSDFWAHPTMPGTVRLVDFGISAAVGNPAGLTEVGCFIGTLAYMAPETIDPARFRGASSAPTIDVFAFGVLAWALLRGSHPTGLPMDADAVSLARRYVQIAAGETRWAATDVVDRWDEILRRCVAPDADLRPADGHAIVRLIDGATAPMSVHRSSATDTEVRQPVSMTEVAGEPGTQAPTVVATVAGGPPGEIAIPPPRAARRAPGQPPTALVVIAAGALGAAAVGGLFHVAGWRDGEASPAADASSLPSAAAPVTLEPMPPAPRAAASAQPCQCKRKVCGGSWPAGTPGGCGDPVTEGGYLLRIGFVGVEPPVADWDAKSLFDIEPGAKVCVRVAGSTDSKWTCVKKPTDQDACSRKDRLPVSLSDLVGDGPGLDVMIAKYDEPLIMGHVAPYDASTPQQRLCDGIVASGSGWWKSPSWNQSIRNVQFYLDPVLP